MKAFLLMVFVIQNTQSRDSKELHVKLDELLRAVENARDTIINCADLSDEELQALEADLQELGKRRAAMLETAQGKTILMTGRQNLRSGN
jgi:low affinity Fe/Cu permease